MRNESTMTLANLPNDLETEILARVPAKSLSQLKTTCKRWYALFKDPKFVEKNKKMSSKSARESMLLNNHEVYSIAGDLHNSSRVIEPSPLEFTGKLSIDLELSRIFHCDGLLLCQAKDNSTLVVWNPCTGQRKMIEPRTRYKGSDTYALGYDSRHSYKILRCGYYQKDQDVTVVESEIYELSSDSWKVLDSFTLDYFLYCTVSLKGNSYWIAAANETCFFLLKFDFITQRFARLPLPFQSESFKDTVLLSVVRDEKLAVSHTLVGSDVMRIWITTNEIDDKDLSWKRDFVLKLDSARSDFGMESFLVDEENRVAVCCGKYYDDGDEYWTMIHICGEDMYKLVYEDTAKASHLNRPFVITYVPSLFRIH